MKRSCVLFIPFLFPLLALLNACNETSTDSNEEIVFPSSKVSYTKQIEPLFLQKCAIAGCHTEASAYISGGLDLSLPSYNKLRDHIPTLVVSGEGTNSLLVKWLDGRMAERMPYKRTPLNANQIQGIKTWINEGAAYN